MGVLHTILTKVPRPILIRASYVARPLYKLFLSGNNFEDPIDGARYRKLLPYGALNKRENALAPGAMSLERHRLMWLYLKEETDFFKAKQLKVLHIAPEQCFYGRFRKQKNLEYITGDLFSPLADVKMDLHDIPFDEDTFDVIFCNHVLEHVKDYKQCMRELYRVMKPGGWGIFQVPIRDAEDTYEDSSITTEEGRLEHFGQKDHLRWFGRDYPGFLREVGFEVEFEDYGQKIGEERRKRFCLPQSEALPFVRKPKA